MLLKVLLQSISNLLLNLRFLISGHGLSHASQSSPPEHQQPSPQSQISHQWSWPQSCFSKFSSRASATFSSISDFSSVVMASVMLLKVLLQSISNLLLNLRFLISGHGLSHASQSS